MNIWNTIQNYGVENERYSDWDKRNLRLMNSMASILAIAMVFFAGLSFIFEVQAALPQLIAAFCVTLAFYPIRSILGLQIAKFYFCIIPIFIIAMFAISVVGEVGNDKYFLLASGIMPLIVFKKKIYYFPLVLANIGTFFIISYAQTIVPPVKILPPAKLEMYININAAVMFVLMYSLLQFFKREIFDYQQLIEIQKELVEEKNFEVQQSIEYAKKIQEAILPPPSFQEKYLPKSFILYKPKDIVAGDFYWMEKEGNTLYFAAADCTGHGVPGAMVSVVCHNALNQALHEFKLGSPAQILDKTRDLVIQTFKRSDREVKDGMDIGLCAYNLKTNELKFAGANNGLYHLKNEELSEIKPNKQPIGNFENPSPFTDHTLNIDKGDIIYLFTDGFADQFGGDKGKKYKYKPFKAFLKQLNKTNITEQGTLIDAEFEKWKGDLEQVDDVCIVGVQF